MKLLNLKYLFRSIYRDKYYSLLNILGLSIGLACGILILMIVIYEFSYDRFHEKSDRIYRLRADGMINNQYVKTATTPLPSGPVIKNQIPEVKNAVRLYMSRAQREVRLQNGNNFQEDNFLWVDDTFFNVFDFKLIRGDSTKVLKEKNTMLLSDIIAKKFFIDEDPIGQIIHIGTDDSYRVTGIFKSIPSNSHFKSDFIASFSSLNEDENKFLKWVTDWNYFTYLLLAENADPIVVERKINSLVHKYIDPLAAMARLKNYSFDLYLQPITDIHLHSHSTQELDVNRDIEEIYIMIALSMFIILIAVINFLNLSTAKVVNRAKEIGIRKTVGAYRSNLISQILKESFTQTFIAFLIAICILEPIVPIYVSITGRNVSLKGFISFDTLLVLAALFILVGLLSGSYPAIVLSSFNPATILKPGITRWTSGKVLRKILVTFQFFIAITMLVYSFAVYDQYNYLQMKKLGFDKNDKLIISLQEKEVRSKYKILKDELININGVRDVSASSSIPFQGVNLMYYSLDDKDKSHILMNSFHVDPDFFKVYGINIFAGEKFSRDITSDQKAIILNETAAKLLGSREPVGLTINIYKSDMSISKYNVLGVVKDFHFKPLRDRIGPLALMLLTDNINPYYLTVSLKSENLTSTLEKIKNLYKGINPEQKFMYFFLDDSLRMAYKEEEQLSEIVNFLTGFAIFLASLGLIGLSTFSIKSRTKEIGIRKALGGSVKNIYFLLISEYLRLIAIAMLISWPVAFYLVKRWLQDFAYRTSVDPINFLISSLIVFFVAAIAITYRALKAANIKPVDALRYE